MPEDEATDKALLATATGSGCPSFFGPLNAKWAVTNDPLEYLQICFPFAIWAVKKRLLLLAQYMLIQRDSHKIYSEMHYHPITWLNLIFHYRNINQDIDLVTHGVICWVCLVQEYPNLQQALTDSFIPLTWYHCQVCIRKLRTRFNLQNNKARCQIPQRSLHKVRSKLCVCECAHNIQHRDKNLYTEPQLAETGSFQSLKNKFHDRMNRNTRSASSQQWKAHNRHLSLKLTSLPELGPSVLCQQPGRNRNVGEMGMGGKG